MQEIRIRIQVPDGFSIHIDTDDGGDSSVTANPNPPPPAPKSGDSAETVPDASWVESKVPVAQQRVLLWLLDRLRAEFDLVGSPPATGERRYLNFHPEPRYGRGRVGGVTLTTRNPPRFYAVLDPGLAQEFPSSEPAEGRYLTVYLRSDDDIELAMSLMRRAMRERGWQPQRFDAGPDLEIVVCRQNGLTDRTAAKHRAELAGRWDSPDRRRQTMLPEARTLVLEYTGEWDEMQSTALKTYSTLPSGPVAATLPSEVAARREMAANPGTLR